MYFNVVITFTLILLHVLAINIINQYISMNNNSIGNSRLIYNNKRTKFMYPSYLSIDQIVLHISSLLYLKARIYQSKFTLYTYRIDDTKFILGIHILT